VTATTEDPNGVIASEEKITSSPEAPATIACQRWLYSNMFILLVNLMQNDAIVASCISCPSFKKCVLMCIC